MRHPLIGAFDDERELRAVADRETVRANKRIYRG
jgi:hypothetical protein